MFCMATCERKGEISMKTGKLLAGPLALLIALVGCSAETIPKNQKTCLYPKRKP